MYTDGFQCNLKDYQKPNYLEYLQNQIDSDRTLENVFNDYQGQFQRFKTYLKKNIFNDPNEFQQHLQNIYHQWDTQFKVELKRIEVFRLIMAMYLGLLERKFSKGGFYIIDMNGIKNANNSISRQKLMCFQNYIRAFYQNSEQIQEEKIVFSKNSVNKEDFKNKFEESTYEDINFEFTQQKNEDHNNSTVVDFADENLGGLVLDIRNCAQEEIIMLIFAEATVCMIFIPPMKETEAVLIENLKKYSNYTGYEQTFQCHPTTDLKGSYNILAIDAKPFNNTQNQFTEENIYRELIKCYAGFEISLKNQPNCQISTGRWGCGIFRGNPYLKTLIQFASFAIAVNELKLQNQNIIINCVNDQHLYNFGMNLKRQLQEKKMQLNLVNLKEALMNLKNGMSEAIFQHQEYNIITQIYNILTQNILQADQPQVGQDIRQENDDLIQPQVGQDIKQGNDDFNQPQVGQDIRQENDDVIQPQVGQDIRQENYDINEPLVSQDIKQEKLLNTQNIEGNKESQFKNNAQIIEEKIEMQIQNEPQINQEKKEGEIQSKESKKLKQCCEILAGTIVFTCIGIWAYKKVCK